MLSEQWQGWARLSIAQRRQGRAPRGEAVRWQCDAWRRSGKVMRCVGEVLRSKGAGNVLQCAGRVMHSMAAAEHGEAQCWQGQARRCDGNAWLGVAGA